MKKYKVKRKKKASVSTVEAPRPMKPTVNVSDDLLKNTGGLEVGSPAKLEIEGKVIEERIDVYSSPQKKSWQIEIHKAKVL